MRADRMGLVSATDFAQLAVLTSIRPSILRFMTRECNPYCVTCEISHLKDFTMFLYFLFKTLKTEHNTEFPANFDTDITYTS